MIKDKEFKSVAFTIHDPFRNLEVNDSSIVKIKKKQCLSRSKLDKNNQDLGPNFYK